MTNKNPVRKAILACSYNDSHDNLEQRVLTQVSNEKRAGKKYLNHLMLRDGEFQLKFNAKLGGVPMFLYGLSELERAGMDKIAVVGNHDTERILSLYKDAFGAREAVFVHEGSNWSYTNTIRRAIEVLDLMPDEHVILLPGDTPFIDSKALATDHDNADSEIILHLNTKDVNGQYFPRNYHFAIKDEHGLVHPAKEPNPWVMNISKLASSRHGLRFFDVAYSSRKAYDGRESQKDMVIDLLLKENGHCSGRRVAKFLGMIGPYGYLQLGKWLSRKALKIAEDEGNLLTIKTKTGERIVALAFDEKIRARVKPACQPGAIIDLDSYQDMAYAEAMLEMNPGLTPHYAPLREFASSIMSWGSDFADSWESWANQKFASYGIHARYTPSGFRQAIFDEKMIRAQVEVIERYNALNN